MGEKLALEGTSFRTLAPVCVIGVQAEETAESFAAGEKMLAQGRLPWRWGSGKQGKSQGKVTMIAWSVEKS
jgi:hypothetical protein